MEILNSMRRFTGSQWRVYGWWLMTKYGSFELQVLPTGFEFFGV
jgi:hypothetical protein